MRRTGNIASTLGVFVFVAGLLLAGCVDSDSQPTAPNASELRVRGLVSHSPAEGVFTILDETGSVSYTVDMTALTLSASDGRVVHLDAEQAALLATEFHGTIIADAITDNMMASLPPFDCNNGAPCEPPPGDCQNGETGGYCQQSTIVGSDELVVGSIVLRRVGPIGRPHQGGSFGVQVHSQIPRLSHGRGGSLGRGFDGVLALSSDPCSEIVAMSMGLRTEHRNSRTSGVELIIAAAYAEGMNGLGHYIIRQGYTAFAMLSGWLADRQATRVSLGVMALIWNGNNCGTNNVTYGPFLKVGGGTVYPSAQLVCVSEQWQISFDGGNTWSNITVSVCSYATS